VKVDVCPVEELPPGHVKIIWSGPLAIGVYNCDGRHYAIEDRCSHDDGDLLDGEFDFDNCTVECPRHGSLFSLRDGKPLNLPAYVPIETFPVRIEDGQIKLEIDY
jgi:3-phenylpropionate/trans-cinnamate dioxygenase ferredoxin subunit